MSLASEIQPLIDAATSGVVKIPPGVYDGDVALTVYDRGNDATDGSLVLDFDGVVLTGSGSLAIDSCKWLDIRGLKALGVDLCINSAWFCTFDRLMMRGLVFGRDAGTDYTPSYYNNFRGGMYHYVLFSQNRVAPVNATWFWGVAIRCNATQGYSDTVDYAIQFNANQPTKGLFFYGGDISYPATAIYRIGGANQSSVEVVFTGVYFDSLNPVLVNTTGPQRKVVMDNCHT